MRILTIIIAVIAFLLIIIAHEFGHFSVAKMMGIRVNEFAIGMGPVLWQKKTTETKYSLRAIPLGGFCAFDEADEERNIKVDPDDIRHFNNQPWWSKILVLLCGPFANIILGLLILFIVYMVAAPQAGIFVCLRAAFRSGGMVLQSIAEFLVSIFNGTVKSEDVSGIVGIVTIVGDAAEFGMINVFYLIGIICVNLGYMNLLPFPALDGGRIILTGLRAVLKDKFPEKLENAINSLGMIALLIIMFLILFKDLGGLG